MSGADLMKTVVAAFAESDLQPLMDALDSEVVWKTASQQPGHFRFHGEYHNRPGILEVLSRISANYTFQYMKPRDVVEAGDVVWGLFDVSLCYDAKGKSIAPAFVQMDMAIRWRLRNGKIIEHQAFFDTAFLRAQEEAARSA